MNILLIGSGGREHALAWKMNQSDLCQQLFIVPGNAGTAQYGQNVAIDPLDFEAVAHLCKQESIDMIFVGPEAPLVLGIEDYFGTHHPYIHVIGPSADAAQLEGSKAFAKVFMQEFGIPTAKYREFNTESLEEGLAYIGTQMAPYVLKADGLASGKGVLICEDRATAQMELAAMLKGKFGDASNRVVIEEFLTGIEFSVFVLTNGEQYKILPVAKDYKRIGEGDFGLNTGGMGAVSNPPFVDAAMMEKVEERIIKPTIAGIKSRGMRYHGVVFIGLISVNGEPYVIEYNCRLGDPETEVVIPRIKNDLVELLLQLKTGQLDKAQLEIDERTAVTVMLVAGGYPEKYQNSKEITGISEVEDSIVFHAGTKLVNEKLVTNGGRVMAITSFGKDLHDALDKSNKNAKIIQYEGKYYRRDIGFDL